MKVRRPVRRMPFVPVASFGDIAFLLIIFFMVASVFMKEANIKVKIAVSEDVEKVKTTPVSVVMDTDGKVWLQGEEFSRDALEPELSVLLQGKTDKKVLLKVDRSQKQKDFGPVIKALSAAGADIVLVGDKRGSL